MKKVAILCNVSATQKTDRPELVEQLHSAGLQPCFGRVFDGPVNSYYSADTALCFPILANRSNTNPLVELRSLRSVKKAVKANGVDAAIVYGVKNHAAMAIGARLGGARRVLCVVNGSGNLFRVGGFKGRLLRAVSFPMLRIAYRCSCAVCFQNADDRALFVQKRLVKDTDKCFVTGGSGVNLSHFPQQALPSENRFLFLSRITPSKGIAEYLRAAEAVKRRYPDAVFDIVGPLDTAVETANDGALQKAVEAGTVNYHGATDDVPAWLATCRFFVYPSYYPEGVPRCAIQAIATGRPIITCRTPGCKETVQDGVNGFMIEPKNSDALAEKMIWMIEHPEAIDGMAQASRALAEAKFDVYRINRELIHRISE